MYAAILPPRPNNLELALIKIPIINLDNAKQSRTGKELTISKTLTEGSRHYQKPPYECLLIPQISSSSGLPGTQNRTHVFDHRVSELNVGFIRRFRERGTWPAAFCTLNTSTTSISWTGSCSIRACMQPGYQPLDKHNQQKK